MNPIEELFKEIESRGTSIAKISKTLDIPVDRIYSWKHKRGNPKAEDVAKIQEWLKKPLQNNEYGAENLNNTVNEALPEYGKPVPQTMEAIIKLIESNELLAKSNSTAIDKIGVALDSNKILVETNKRLADRVLSQPVNVAPQTSLAENPRMKDLLGLIADVASGKRFESRREALTVIHKLMHDKPENASVMDTQKG